MAGEGLAVIISWLYKTAEAGGKQNNSGPMALPTTTNTTIILKALKKYFIHKVLSTARQVIEETLHYMQPWVYILTRNPYNI